MHSLPSEPSQIPPTVPELTLNLPLNAHKTRMANSFRPTTVAPLRQKITETCLTGYGFRKWDHSEAVINTPELPTPATLPLFATGLGLMALFLQRRLLVHASAAA